jgi:hypothetical protein
VKTAEGQKITSSATVGEFVSRYGRYFLHRNEGAVEAGTSMKEATRNRDICEWKPLGEILKIIVKDGRGGCWVYYADVRDRLGMTMPGMAKNKNQRYLVWKTERAEPQAEEQPEEKQQVDPQAAELPEENPQDPAAAEEDAEMEAAAATGTGATNEEVRKEEDKTTSDSPDRAAEKPTEATPRRSRYAKA